MTELKLTSKSKTKKKKKMDRVFSCLQQVTKMAHPCQNTPFAQANAAITNEVISTFFFFFLKQETHTHTPAKASDVRGDTHIKKKKKREERCVVAL